MMAGTLSGQDTCHEGVVNARECTAWTGVELVSTAEVRVDIVEPC